jgi:hypothetical protein
MLFILEQIKTSNSAHAFEGKPSRRSNFKTDTDRCSLIVQGNGHNYCVIFSGNSRGSNTTGSVGRRHRHYKHAHHSDCQGKCKEFFECFHFCSLLQNMLHLHGHKQAE